MKKLGSLDKAIAEREKEEKARKQAIAQSLDEEIDEEGNIRKLDDQIAVKLQKIATRPAN